MYRQQLGKLLIVNQQNDYTWKAFLPELIIMWATGHSESEARENWLRKYDQPAWFPLFAYILHERSKHPQMTIEGTKTRTSIQRPATVDFPYRGKLYRIETNKGLPRCHIILPDSTILVVCDWIGRVPATLADIRRSPEPITPESVALQLDGVLAEEIPLLSDQTTHPMGILDWQGQRYAINTASNALVEMPDGRLYRVEEIYPEEPVRIAKIISFDPDHHYMPYQLQTFGKTPAIPVASDYPGMAREPRDIRIRFVIQDEQFILSHEAYERRKGIVFVPDYGFYRICIYLESIPIKLGDLSFLPGDHHDLNDVAIALRYVDAVDVEPQE